MKRIALAVLALSTFAGCAAPSSDAVSESTAALATQQTIAINLKTDVTGLVCDQRPDAMLITFDYEGHTFETDQNSQNIWGCEGQRLSLENAGARSGTLIEDVAGALVTRTLLVDSWKFTSVEEPGAGKGTTANVILDLAVLGARCVVKQGWFIEFTFDGRRFDGYGADDVTDCKKALSALESGTKNAHLITEPDDNATKRTLVIPGSPTTFTSYDPL